MSGSPRSPIVSGALLAIASAVAFGVSTPLVARLGQGLGPLTTAASLYAGAAILSLVRPFSARSGRKLGRSAVPRLAVIALFGAALAPTLLAWGLQRTGSLPSSLVLNFEAVLTVLLAWVLYKEHVGARVGFALTAMVVGGALVAFDSARAARPAQLAGLAAVLGATACWAIDNGVTRALSEEDPFDVIAAKAGLGAAITASLSLVLGEPRPELPRVLGLIACGATGYGLSLRLYLQAQRRMGAARTGSVFATAPFVGAALAWSLGERAAGAATALGAAAFAVGVYLHLSERHSHAHVHAALEHEHAHRHDDGHHLHVHDPPFTGEHTHPHRHERLEHEHEHAPDVHHEHRHS